MNHQVASMDRKIFDMRLDVEAVSTYILCCALKDAGTPVCVKHLKEKWNGEIAALEKGLVQLEKRNVISKAMENQHDPKQEYILLKSSVWQ